MRHLSLLLLLFFVVSGCESQIKDENAEVEVESGAEVSAGSTDDVPAAAADQSLTEEKENILGFWVGDFRQAGTTNEFVVADEWYWGRDNKINISLERVAGDSVFGKSVVAGNDRPFAGIRRSKGDSGGHVYEVREPGDDRYDGAFTFTIEDNRLSGTWEAYGKVEIPERSYSLAQMTFVYNPNQNLEPAGQYVDWNKSKKGKREGFDGQTEAWFADQFAASTEKIYDVNASAERLTTEQVENLKKGDLTIIRNTIYARHGYSFKNRPLRVFFDAQPWYIPVHADIRADFTDIEKENIQLLLKYEKNAAEYYDYFGRG